MRILLLVIAFAVTQIISAEVKPASLFQNNMVMQRNQVNPVFGFATFEKKVTVFFLGKEYKSKVKNGRWQVNVDAIDAGGPHEMTIIGDNEITISNILVGEVWLCSGQSNMEMPLKGFMGQPINGSNMAALKSNNDNIRLFTVERKIATQAQPECVGVWNKCTPQYALNFSAVAYFYGKMLQETLGVPVGLINSSWGGTPAQAWTPEASLQKQFPEFNTDITAAKQDNPKSPRVLYNGMINPLKHYGIKGVIWYQGEANKKNPKQYESLFPAMVKSWREEWEQGDFPFYYVQIAPLAWGGDKQQELREAQLKSLQSIPNSGMAVTLDIGEPYCIHPGEKKKVGERLALLALNKTYGLSYLQCDGPIYKSMEIKKAQAYLQFVNTPDGLCSFENELTGFEIAGADKVFYEAKSKISRGQLVVWSEEVKEPVSVRYGWMPWIKGCLFNTAGLPASSFRTDDW